MTDRTPQSMWNAVLYCLLYFQPQWYRSMQRLRTLSLVALLVVLTACATSPTGQRQLRLFSEAQMAEMGAASYAEMKEKTPASSRAVPSRRVQCVANALTGLVGGGWEVTLFEDESANAFALPGGKIGVYAGLLNVAETPDQLAAVIGHEIAHVTAHHANARMSASSLVSTGMQVAGAISEGTALGQQAMAALGLGAQVGILLPYGRGQESEADVLGLDIMAQAGFDPRQAVTLWENMARQGGGGQPEFLSTHPSHGTRIADLNARMPAAMKLYEQARGQGRRPGCP